MTSLFVVNEEVKIHYAGLYLLKEICEGEELFLINVHEEHEVLKPIVDWLMRRGFVELDSEGLILASDKGQDFLESFLDRYRTFLKEYDVFCGVDLANKEFAMSYYPEYGNTPEWADFLNQEKWEDLRIAIAEYKGYDSIEIVFMSFVQEERFGRNHDGWNHELLLGQIWNEIQYICNTAVRLYSLRYEEKGLVFEGPQVLEELIVQGQTLMQKMRELRVLPE